MTESCDLLGKCGYFEKYKDSKATLCDLILFFYFHDHQSHVIM